MQTTKAKVKDKKSKRDNTMLFSISKRMLFVCLLFLLHITYLLLTQDTRVSNDRVLFGIQESNI